MNGKLGFGAMRLPLRNADDPSSIDLPQLERMVDLFLGYGFRYFDTAYTYCGGHSEKALRQTLVERCPRDRFILADKLPTMSIRSADEQPRIFDEQLRRCGVDYFDRYMVHCALPSFYERAGELGSFDFVRSKRDEGLARAIGFSFHGSAELLDRILTEHPETDFVQLQINYVDWQRSPLRARGCLETARRHGKPVTVMGALKGGLLAAIPPMAERRVREVSGGCDPASWALRFAASLEGVDYVLSGMTSIADVERNCTALQAFSEFTAGEYATVDEIADAVCGATPVQCTSCGYCLGACPERIAIPDCLHLYNSYSRMFGARNYIDEYQSISNRGGRPSSCVGCRRCEQNCPQHLRIADWIRRVADAFEYHCLPAGVQL